MTALLVPRVVDVVCRITRAAGRWQTLGNGEMAMSLRMPDLVGIAYGYYQATDPADILSLAFADVNRAQVLLRRPNGGIGYWRHHGHIINAIGCEQQHGFRATVVFGAAFSSLFYAPSRAAFLRQVVRSIGGLIDAVPVVTPASPFLSQSRVP
ncbi:MAG TPA: hypothetical protein VFQ88_14070 [Nevskiaceae bacterium]|nr:hypothetical protein [Nevskiaceae bacterium]